MSNLEELIKRMDRVKELMDATGKSMEELMAESAMSYVACSRCPIKSKCDQYMFDENVGCSEVWEKYLKGEIQ